MLINNKNSYICNMSTKISKDAFYKREDLKKRIEDKLKESLDRYNHIRKNGDDPEPDKEAFDIVNTDWRIFCHFIKRTQKLVTPNVYAFTLAIYPDSIKVTVEEKEKEPKIINEL